MRLLCGMGWLAGLCVSGEVGGVVFSGVGVLECLVGFAC